MEEQARSAGYSSITAIHYAGDGFNAATQVADLKQKGIDTVFLLGSGSEAAALF